MRDEDLADIRDWAERFWLLAGQSEPFPRSLESAVSWALPLTIIKLPRLDGETINDYLQQVGLSPACRTTFRALRGCLLARGGSGMVFLDGTDPADEMRFTLAHEVAHFLLDHLHPRQRAVQALGSSIHEVLDGLRDPTSAERLNALLQSVSFERLDHYLDRQTDGTIGCQKILRAEDRADRLALELLAPIQSVEESLAAQSATGSDANAGNLIHWILVKEYGLPREIAKTYSRFLVNQRAPRESFRDWLRGKK